MNNFLNRPKLYLYCIFVFVLSTNAAVKPTPAYAASCDGNLICSYDCGQGTCDVTIPCEGTTCAACDDFASSGCPPFHWYSSDTCGWSVSCQGIPDCNDESGGTCPGANYGDTCSGGDGTCEPGPANNPHKCSCVIDDPGEEDTPPTAPNTPTPAHQSTVSGQTVSLGFDMNSWGHCTGGNTNTTDIYLTTRLPSQPCPVKSDIPPLASCQNIADTINKIYCPVAQNLNQATKYCWYAEASNGCLTSIPSATWSFTTCTPTSPTVNLSSPPNGSSISSSSQLLSWTGSFNTGCWANNDDYNVYRVTKTGPTCPANFTTPAPGCNSVTTQTSCTTTNLAVGSSYCWKVSSTNGSLTTTSPTWEFCYGSLPSATTLQAPAHQAGVTSLVPKLDWNDISNWGTSCGAAGYRGFRAYRANPVAQPGGALVCPGFNDANLSSWTPVCTVNATTSPYATDCDVPPSTLAQNTNYCWGVATSTNSAFPAGSNAYSATRTFRTPVNLTGKIWDATGVTSSCATQDNLGSISTSASAQATTNYDSGSGSTYQDGIDTSGNFSIQNVALPTSDVDNGAGSLSGINLVNPPTEPYTYQLKCFQGAFTTGGGSGVSIPDFRANFSNLDMGFEQVPRGGWTQTLLGDIFVDCAGCTQYGITQAMPFQDLGNLYDANPYMVDSSANIPGSSFGLAITNGNEIQAEDWLDQEDKTSGGDTGFTNFKVENYDLSGNPQSLKFPSNIDFTNPPASAIVVPNAAGTITCANFLSQNNAVLSNRIYRTDPNCFNTMIGANRTYSFNGSAGTGAVVLYVTGSGNYTLQNRIENISPNGSDRLIIIVNGSITVSESLPAAETLPISQTGTAGHIEATIIANGNINSRGPGGAASLNDRTLIVEGSLISTSAVTMTRNKGINNVYPSELIRYQAKDLIFLNDAEMASFVLNTEHTGLHMFDVEWEVE